MTQYIGNVPEGAKYEVFDMSTNYNGDRNTIINGHMAVNQRNFTSATPGSSASFVFPADRFWYYHDHDAGAGAMTVSRETDVPTLAQAGCNFSASYKVLCNATDTVISGNNEVTLGYTIEGYDYLRLKGGDATLSLWVKSNKTGVYTVSFRNSGNDRTYLQEITVNAADTWEQKTVTVPLTETGGTWDETNGKGLAISLELVPTAFVSTAGSWLTGNYVNTSSNVNIMDTIGNYFMFTGVKIEPGDTASQFVIPRYEDELYRCQRYYQTIYVPTYSTFGSGRGMGTTAAYTPVLQLRTVMRTTPTGNTSTSGDIQIKRISDNTSLSSTENISIIGVDNTSYRWGMTYTHSSPDETYRLNTTASAFTGTLSAEL